MRKGILFLILAGLGIMVATRKSQSCRCKNNISCAGRK
jgi:hypothetical protein